MQIELIRQSLRHLARGPGRAAQVIAFSAIGATLTTPAFAAEEKSSAQCGAEGVWIQVLGGGGPELNDSRSAASYVVWQDDSARLLVDTAPGTSAAFDKSGARFADLEVIVFTNLQAQRSSELAAVVESSQYAERTEPLVILGPDSSIDAHPGMSEFTERLIGANGAYPYLSPYLKGRSPAGYRISVRDVPSTGNRRWAQFGTDRLRLSAIPVHHGDVPAIAWRVEIGGQVIVFTGDFNNSKNVIARFAEDADALVVHHSVPETARGSLRELHVIPSQIGQIANQANARMLILGHRMNRTRGRESQSIAAIEKHYNRPLIFADDMECWGM